MLIDAEQQTNIKRIASVKNRISDAAEQ